MIPGLHLLPGKDGLRTLAAFLFMALLLVSVGLFQSWSVAVTILNLCLISAVMALGLNIQWGYAGLFNAGVMGFTALGGLAAVLVAQPPVAQAWAAGGVDVLIMVGIILMAVGLIVWTRRRLASSPFGGFVVFLLCILAYFLARGFHSSGSEAIEAVEPSLSGYLGGAG
ncbi:MAG: branched-chain amino acid ABC transporter permease, partial [Gammaproteobacteria bacterium]